MNMVSACFGVMWCTHKIHFKYVSHVQKVLYPAADFHYDLMYSHVSLRWNSQPTFLSLRNECKGHSLLLGTLHTLL